MGSGYGQAAPPSAYPGYYYPYQFAPAAPPLPRKRHTAAIIIGVVAAIVVICGSGIALLALASYPLHHMAIALQPTPPYGVSGTPFVTPTVTEHVIYQNPLTATALGWANDTHCSFANDGYHAKNGYVCYAPVGKQSDIDVSVQVHQISGLADHHVAIWFRVTPGGAQYGFLVVGDGAWKFGKYDGTQWTDIVPYTSNNAVNGGLTATNLLRVQAIGSHFAFFINGTQVGQADDSSYTSGFIGLGVESGIEAVFTNLTIFQPVPS
jgi:hypothetical protein